MGGESARRVDYLIYSLPFVFSLLVAYYLLGMSEIDITSTRYLLSSLAQCEAAILAIVVSLSLIVIQLATSSYSHRLIDMSFKTLEFWLMIYIYVFSIVLTLLTLRFVNVYPERSVALWTAVCCSLGVFCFFWLIPYTLTMIDLLRPGTILDSILNEVKKTKDQNKITHMIDMYFAIIIRALSQHEYLSAAEGLIKIGDVLEYFDEDLLLQIYLWIRDTIKLMKESGSEIIICESIEDVCKNIGLIAISRNYKWVDEVISLIDDFGKALVDRRSIQSLAALDSLKDLWDEAIKYKRVRVLDSIVKSIGELGKNKYISRESIEILNKFKNDCEKLGLNELVKAIDNYLKDLSKLDESG